MNGDNKAAIDFLKKWKPKGPWVLTSIQTDRKGINTATNGDRDWETRTL